MPGVRVSSRTSGSTGKVLERRRRPPALKLKERAEVWVLGTGSSDIPWMGEDRDSGLLGSGSVVVLMLTSEAAGDAGPTIGSRRIEDLLEEPVGTPVSLSRSEAVEVARRLFGSDRLLPSGAEYVRRTRGDWTLRLG